MSFAFVPKREISIQVKWQRVRFECSHGHASMRSITQDIEMRLSAVKALAFSAYAKTDQTQ
jgi:hypothetical protein